MTVHDLLHGLESRIRPPLGIVLGSPREAVELVAAANVADAVCYQLDLFQAERLQAELASRNLQAGVATAPDLWDLPAEFQTLIYPVPKGGERSLKIDMIEQSFHVLRPRGKLIVLTPYETDPFIPLQLKKVFGRVHHAPAGEAGYFWSLRERERPRRRHEVTFHARVGESPALHFISRPGVFSYGRFDDGARALVETMRVEPGDRVLDIGCGCGTNGIFAGLASGSSGHTTFVDSNVRAVALTALNATANGLEGFQTVATSGVERVPAAAFDVALANPPYFAQAAIARLFIERARVLLRPGGRFFLVTKQPDEVGPLVAENFGLPEPVLRRGYTVLCAQAPEAMVP